MRSSNGGTAQTRSPSSSISAGRRTIRTAVASSRIATVRPIPIWLTVAIGAAAKETKTAAMIAAAPVITPAVRSNPKEIAARLSPSTS